MSKRVADEVRRIMSDMSFHPTDVLINTLADMINKYNVIDHKIIAELFKRHACDKQAEEKTNKWNERNGNLP